MKKSLPLIGLLVFGIFLLSASQLTAEKKWTWYIYSKSYSPGSPGTLDLTIGIKSNSPVYVDSLGNFDLEGDMNIVALYDFDEGLDPYLLTDHLTGDYIFSVDNPVGDREWNLECGFLGSEGEGDKVTEAGIPVATIRYYVRQEGSSDLTLGFPDYQETYYDDNSTKVDSVDYDNTEGASFLVHLEAKVFLEGPYDDIGNEMITDLKTNGSIPTTSPYSDSRTVNPIPADVVDWMFVELRSTKTGAAVASRSTFLHKDGRIVDDDGITEQVIMSAVASDYYIVIRHRNHLAVMSDETIALSIGSATLYDFTIDESTPYDKYEGGDAALLETGIYGMYAGDGNYSGICTIEDGNLALSNRDAVGYYASDYNMSSIVTISDVNLSDSNRDASTNVN
jgi:hypothetical protein